MLLLGEVAEWFNAAVLKTVEGASPPRVRISASPPIIKSALDEQAFFLCLMAENDANGTAFVLIGQSLQFI